MRANKTLSVFVFGAVLTLPFGTGAFRQQPGIKIEKLPTGTHWIDRGVTDASSGAIRSAPRSFVNRHGGLLLNTSNKTELSLGYATLYGDMAGGLCPIADLTKPEVVALARWIDANRCPIPRFTLERPPSAELRPDQVDPFNYPRISPLMERLVRQNRSNPALRRSEHKRWQMGVVLKVSEKAFGTGRLIPITRR